MATLKPTSLLLASDRVLSYAVTPPLSSGDHPSVLLANCLCAPLAVWDPVVPTLTELGFRVLRYDQPGHGLSGVPPDLSSTTFDSMAQDVRTLLDHLDVKKLHAWVGVSMGAAVGIVFAAKYPGVIARLVPCDTISMSPVNAGTPDVFGPRVSAAREAGNMHATVEGTLERWFGRPWMGSNAAETERMRKLMHGTSIDGFDACCAALRSTSFDLRPLAAKAGSGADSAMLLVGEKDTPLIQSMEELRQGIERGLRSKKDEAATVELRIVKNGGHVCFVDGFESFVGHITKFLA